MPGPMSIQRELCTCVIQTVARGAVGCDRVSEICNTEALFGRPEVSRNRNSPPDGPDV